MFRSICSALVAASVVSGHFFQFEQEECVNCWMESAKVSIQRGPVSFESQIPHGLIQQFRQTQFEEISKSAAFKHLVRDLSQSVSSVAGYGSLVENKKTPVRVYDHSGIEVMFSENAPVNFDRVFAVSIEGVMEKEIRPKNSEYWFVVEDVEAVKPVTTVTALDFPMVELIFEQKEQKPVVIDMAYDFVSFFFAHSQQLTKQQFIATPVYGFEWVTIVKEDKPSKLNPNAPEFIPGQLWAPIANEVRREVGFMIHELERQQAMRNVHAVYVHSPQEQYYMDLQIAEFNRKQKAIENLNKLALQGDLTWYEQQLIAHDYAVMEFPEPAPKAIEYAYITVERKIVELEFIGGNIFAQYQFFPLERSTAARIFLESPYAIQVTSVVYQGVEPVVIIRDQTQLEAALISFLSTHQADIFAAVAQADVSRRQPQEMASWNALFGVDMEVVAANSAMEEALRREREEAARVQRLNAMLQNIHQAQHQQVAYEQMWAQIQAPQVYQLYGEPAPQYKPLTSEEIEVLEFYRQIQTGQKQRCDGYRFEEEVSFETVQETFYQCETRNHFQYV